MVVEAAGRMKSYAEYLALLDAEGDPFADETELALLAGAMLDGGVADLELGALFGSIRRRGQQPSLLRALLSAVDRRVTRWRGEGPMPVVIGCYGGAADVPTLSPLLALLLARFDVPVLMHGPLHSDQGVSAALVLRELGIMPCAQQQQAAVDLATRRIAFVPDALLAPGLAFLAALRARLGPLPLLVTAGRLIDPFDCGSLVIAAGDHSDEVELMRLALASSHARCLLLRATGGEAFADPGQRPRMEHWQGGEVRVLFEEDRMPLRQNLVLPAPLDAAATAAWIRQACEGARPVPTPIVNQLAATLYATGYCSEFNQAKALAAIAAARRQVA
jgi:anthranilate phosphoribosyltransferase